MPPKEIHEDLKNVGKEYPSYNTVNKWASDPEFKRGRGSTEEHQRCHHWWKCQGRAHPGYVW